MADETEKTVEFTLHGHTITLYLPDVTDLVQRKIWRRQGFYEPELLEDARSRVRTGGLCIDVGAHIGNHTVFFAKVCGLRVLAFEPQPDVFRILQRNIELNGLGDRVQAFNVALGETSGRGSLTRAIPHNTGTATLRPDPNGPVTVEILDQHLGEQPVDLLKIDTEGFALEVLKGATQSIARDKPIIYAEAGDARSQNSLEAFLAPLGYLPLDKLSATPVLVLAHCGTEEERFAAFVARFNRAQEEVIARLERQARSSDMADTVLAEWWARFDGKSVALDQHMEQLRSELGSRIGLLEKRLGALAGSLDGLVGMSREHSALLYELWNLGVQSHDAATGRSGKERSAPAPVYRPLHDKAREIATWHPRRKSWTIPRGTEADAFLQGYTTRISVHAGGEIGFRVSTDRTALFACIRVFRLADRGQLGAQEVHCSPPLSIPTTGVWRRDGGRVEAPEDWVEVYTLRVDEGWKTGCYVARIETLDGNAFLHPFWVTDPTPSAPIVLISAVLTHIAHNKWGHTALHKLARRLPLPGVARFRSVRLYRPYSGCRGGRVLRHEFPFLRWADIAGLRLDCVTDLEIYERPEILAGYNHAVIAGDASYFTRELVDALAALKREGKSISVFGAAPGKFEVVVDAGAGTMTVVAQTASQRAAWRRANADLWQADGQRTHRGKPADLCFRTEGAPAALAGTGINESPRIAGLCGDRLSGTTVDRDSPALLARTTVDVNGEKQNCDTTLVDAPQGGRVFLAGTDRWAWALDDHLPREDVSVSVPLRALTARILGADAVALRPQPLVFP